MLRDDSHGPAFFFQPLQFGIGERTNVRGRGTKLGQLPFHLFQLAARGLLFGACVGHLRLQRSGVPRQRVLLCRRLHDSGSGGL